MDDTNQAPTLSAASMEALRLTHQPFATPLGPDVMYEDFSLTTQMNVALQILQSAGPILLLCGPAGIGKSVFIRWLEYKVGHEFLVCRVNARLDMSLEDVINECRVQLKIPPGRPGSETFARFRTQLHGMIDEGHRVTLLIDNADLLSEEVLREIVILKMEFNERPVGMGLLLTAATVSSTEIPYGYAQMIPAQDAHAIHLTALSEEQTAAYVRHHLFVAGMPSETEIPKGVLKKIYRRARGIPADINDAAAMALDALHGSKGMSLAKLWPMAAAVAGLAVVGGFAYLYEKAPPASTPNAEGTVTVDLPPPAAKLPDDPIPPAAPEPSVAAASDTTLPPGDAAPAVQAPAENPTAATPTAEIAAEPAPAPPAPVEPIAEAPAAPTPPQPAEPAPISTATTTPTEQPAAPAEPAPVAAAPAPAAPSAPEQPEAVAEPKAPEQPATPSVAESPVSQPPKVAAKPKKSASSKPQGDAWVTSQPNNHYTVQLLGSRNRAKLNTFLSGLSIREPVGIYQAQRNGETWYFAVMGSYASQAAAKAALADLPATAKQAGAWARTFGSIQQR